MKHAEVIITKIRQLPKYKVYYENGSEFVDKSDHGHYMKVGDIEKTIAEFITMEGGSDKVQTR